jgi:hypothetical protein
VRRMVTPVMAIMMAPLTLFEGKAMKLAKCLHQRSSVLCNLDFPTGS